MKRYDKKHGEIGRDTGREGSQSPFLLMSGFLIWER